MTIRPILRLGDPRLRQVSAPVKDLADPALAQLRAGRSADRRAAAGGAVWQWSDQPPLSRGTTDRTVEGFHARVVQHECDHLDGVLFPDRLSDPHAFGFLAELEAAGQIPAVPS